MFNQIERNIIREADSLLADRMKLHIAKRKFEREFMKTQLGLFLRITVDWLNERLS